MTTSEIKKELCRVAGPRQPFISVAEICQMVGDSNSGRVKKKYLSGLEKVGKGYFIPDVAQRMKEAAVVE